MNLRIGLQTYKEWEENMSTAITISIILAILNFFLLLTFRISDKKKYGYDQATALKEQLVTDIRNSDDVFKQDIADISATLSTQEKQVKSYISLLKTELDTMMSYKEDFKLCNIAINNCKNAVQGLISLTEEATERTRRIEETMVTIKEMESKLTDFSKDVSSKIRENANNIIISSAEELNALKEKYSQEIQAINQAKMSALKGEDPTFNLNWNTDSSQNQG